MLSAWHVNVRTRNLFPEWGKKNNAEFRVSNREQTDNVVGFVDSTNVVWPTNRMQRECGGPPRHRQKTTTWPTLYRMFRAISPDTASSPQFEDAQVPPLNSRLTCSAPCVTMQDNLQTFCDLYIGHKKKEILRVARLRHPNHICPSRMMTEDFEEYKKRTTDFFFSFPPSFQDSFVP
jgi:hypothetical protein